MSWYWYPRPKPRRPADGIKAKTQRGQFGKTWWASQWIEALERLVDPGRLSRGRSYARSGQVLNLDLKPGRVNSKVQGSMPSPYKVEIAIEPLTNKEWDKVIGAMAAQAIFAAKLLAGEMPHNIEEAFAAAGVSLFPADEDDLNTECSCPDWSNPCKHIAAVYYLLGEQFDDDPFLLFRLRGRDKEQVLAALRAKRSAGKAEAKAAPRKAAAKPAEKFTPLKECVENFWETGGEIESLHFNLARPEVEAAPVKRLGEPSFWTDKPGFTARLASAYESVAEAALELAVGEVGA
jgi:uncharacterized Zn finger protein